MEMFTSDSLNSETKYFSMNYYLYTLKSFFLYKKS